MNRPLHDPADTTGVDESTDTYDTVEWLLDNVPGNNGRVGVLGVSYPGFLATMAGINPHPAVKAVSPQAPMTDTWMGDDFFHQGAFRLSYGFEYVVTGAEQGRVGEAPDRHLGHLRLVPRAWDRWPTSIAKYFHGKVPPGSRSSPIRPMTPSGRQRAVQRGLKAPAVPTLTSAAGGIRRTATGLWRPTRALERGDSGT